MAVLSIRIPDEKQDKIVDNFCAAHGYTLLSGLTKLAFVRKVVMEFILKSAAQGIVDTRQEVARQAAIEETKDMYLE